MEGRGNREDGGWRMEEGGGSREEGGGRMEEGGGRREEGGGRREEGGGRREEGGGRFVTVKPCDRGRGILFCLSNWLYKSFSLSGRVVLVVVVFVGHGL